MKILLKEEQLQFLTLYHGTCNPSHFTEKGWSPNSGGIGGNQGQSKYLYLSSHPEDARWFANEKGCNDVVRVKNIPLSYLAPDPDDEAGYSMQELLDRMRKSPMPSKFVLNRPLGKEHFEKL